jgi:rubrerythrin
MTGAEDRPNRPHPETVVMQGYASGLVDEAATIPASLEERLLSIVESHAAAEQDSLDEYRRMADETGDPVVRLLMRMVLEDEERHHQLLAGMASSLRDALQWTQSAGALPAGAPPESLSSPALLAATRARIQEEQEGVRHFKNLAKRQARVADGLFSLLLETLAMDSQKHERILRFVLKRAEASR